MVIGSKTHKGNQTDKYDPTQHLMGWEGSSGVVLKMIGKVHQVSRLGVDWRVHRVTCKRNGRQVTFVKMDGMDDSSCVV